MSNFIEFLEYKALNVKYKNSNLHARIIDSYYADTANQEDIRQMCAKVSIKLIERLDRVTESMDISKREFIEFAVIDALDTAENVLEERGINDWFSRMHGEADEASRQREPAK